MHNLLRGEYFKLKRNKCFWWCIFATAVMIFMIFFFLMLVGQIMQGAVENGTTGIVVMGGAVGEDSASLLEEMGLLEMVQQLFAGDYMMIVLAVFIGIFMASEYGNGTLKNIIGKGHSREKVYLSRFLAAAAAVVVLILFGVCACLVCGLVFMGREAFMGSFWGELFLYVGLELVMNLSLVAVFMLVGEVVRNMAGSICAGLGIAIFSTLAVSGLDLVSVRLGVGIRLADYYILDLSMGCPVRGLGAADIGKALLISAAWLAAALGAGVWHFGRTDIS